MALSEVYVSVPMPRDLAQRLRQVADRDSSNPAATARRLIALGLARESQKGVGRDRAAADELAACKS
jgi:hypothetical protein